MAKNTDTSIKLLVLYDILCKMTDEDEVLLCGASVLRFGRDHNACGCGESV